MVGSSWLLIASLVNAYLSVGRRERETEKPDRDRPAQKWRPHLQLLNVAAPVIGTGALVLGTARQFGTGSLGVMVAVGVSVVAMALASIMYPRAVTRARTLGRIVALTGIVGAAVVLLWVGGSRS